MSFTPVHGAATSQLCRVESERHTVNSDTTWVVEFGLSPFQTDYANRSADFYYFGTTLGTKVGAV